LSAELTKTYSFRLFFGDFAHRECQSILLSVDIFRRFLNVAKITDDSNISQFSLS